MDGTILQQGSFVSLGTPKYLEIRTDVDWIRIFNMTETAAGNINHGVEYFWTRDMQQNALTGICYYRIAANNTLASTALAAASNFQLYDTSAQTSVTGNVIVGVNGALPPVVSTNFTAAQLATGDVVRFTNITGAGQICGMDFTIGAAAAGAPGTFTLAYSPAIVAAGAPGATSRWHKVLYDPEFFPCTRYITSITQAASAVVTLSVTHAFSVDQEVGFRVPEQYGMTQINNLRGKVTAINAVTNTVTVNIDTTGFTAFAMPLDAAWSSYSKAELVPVGENNNLILSTATRNISTIGILLPAGLLAPAGSVNDVICWVAGKSVNK
jgi:hypothetical protein